MKKDYWTKTGFPVKVVTREDYGTYPVQCIANVYGVLYECSYTEDLKYLHYEDSPADLVETPSEHTFTQWSVISKRYTAIARDSCGTWYAYTCTPKRNENGWVAPGANVAFTPTIPPLFFPRIDNWQDSLILRTL
jgi:hypothetical protein